MHILKPILISTIISALFLSSSIASASVVPPTIPCPEDSSLPCIGVEKQKDPAAVRRHIFEEFGGKYFATFLGLVGATSVVFLIVGGLQMHLALGNEETLTRAKKTVVWAIVGLVFAILSVAIVQIISNLPYEPPAPK